MELEVRKRPGPGPAPTDLERSLRDATREALDRAATALAMATPTHEPPPLTDGERLAGDRALARWRATFGLGSDMLPPVGTPGELAARLAAAWEGRKPTKEVSRMSSMLSLMASFPPMLASNGEALPICIPDLVSATKDTYYSNVRFLSRAAVQTVRETSAFLADPARPVDADYRRQLLRLRSALAILDRYPPDPDGVRFQDRSTWGTGPWHRLKAFLDEHPEFQIKKGAGKKLAHHRLQKAVPDYLDRMWLQAQDGPYADAVALMLATGARPAEIVNGINVGLRADGTLVMFVQSAKLRAGTTARVQKGLPWRQLEADSNAAPWLRHLASLARFGGGSMLVRFEDPTKPDATAVANRFKNVVWRLGTHAYPDFPERISPYVFRHAFSARLKASGLSTEEVAIAMGQLSVRTPLGYGASYSGKGGTKPVASVKGTPGYAVRGSATGYAKSGFPARAPKLGR